MLSPQGENLRTASKIQLRPRHDSLGKGISHPRTTNTCRARRRNRPAPATGCFFLLDSGSIRVERMAGLDSHRQIRRPNDRVTGILTRRSRDCRSRLPISHDSQAGRRITPLISLNLRLANAADPDCVCSWRSRVASPITERRKENEPMNHHVNPAAPDTALITEQRLALRAHGYNPVPLAGKAVTLKAWQKRTEATEHEIRSWPRAHPAQTNTGILTRNNPAFDVDVLSSAEIADAAAEVIAAELAAIGGRVMVRFGRRPKRAILCRTSEPFKKIKVELDSFFADPDTGEVKYDAIEVLCDPQQIACLGIHPDTGGAYEWVGGAPTYVPASDLPLITEADARAIVDKIIVMMAERFGINDRTSAKAARPDTPVAEAKTTDTATAYGAAALRSACETIVNAESGSQEATLNGQCYGIGQLVGGGELPEAEALSALRAAVERIPDHDPANPWKTGDLARKVERSFTEGKSKPRAAPEAEPAEFLLKPKGGDPRVTAALKVLGPEAWAEHGEAIINGQAALYVTIDGGKDFKNFMVENLDDCARISECMRADEAPRAALWLLIDAEPEVETEGPRAEARRRRTVRFADFVAYLPSHQYIYKPTRDMWPASSVDSTLPWVKVGTDKKGDDVMIRAALWLDQNRPVEQMTWAPGMEMLIKGRLVAEGGWVGRPGATVFNLYRPPSVALGDASKAGRWVDHIGQIYPESADHIVNWLASRVQRPEVKINHALVFGGNQGIGKDTILEPVKNAVGPWNFSEASPPQILGRFNSFLKSVILRVSEARDLGDSDRFAFYEHMKPIIAAPPDVLRVDEKHLREHSVFNVVGVIITTNNKSNGIYLPADDRRHYVAWSEKKKEDFTETYWNDLWRWYGSGGFGHVAAYLSGLDLSGFNPKAPPPHTSAFWEIVDASRSPEDSELADVLDGRCNPAAVTLEQLISSASEEFSEWLRDRKNRRAIPYRLEQCGYVAVRNDAAKDGLWKIRGARQAVYAKQELSIKDRITAARRLT
jgi:hypothetical protein